MRSAFIVVVAFVGSLFVSMVGLQLTGSGSDGTADVPDWVEADGTINTDQMPDSFPLIGANAEPVLDCNGDPVMIDSAEWFDGFGAPETLDPEAVHEMGHIEEDGVVVNSVDVHFPGFDSNLIPDCGETE